LASQASDPTHETAQEISFGEFLMMHDINDDLLRRLEAAAEVLHQKGHAVEATAVRQVLALLNRGDTPTG
jgi:hypothetical protein